MTFILTINWNNLLSQVVHVVERIYVIGFVHLRPLHGLSVVPMPLNSADNLELTVLVCNLVSSLRCFTASVIKLGVTQNKLIFF